MPVPMLEARALAKTYPGGVEALAGVDLAVAMGETVALVGESGCGKSTLLRCFNRMVTPSGGEARVRGRPVEEQDLLTLRRSLGYVPQDGGLLPHWPVGRNVALVTSLLGWSRDRQRARARQMLELVGLPAERFAARYPRDLSGGQRQRVAFARALAADPDAILLDEPFGALDALTRLELRRTFHRLRAELETTLLLVTHDLDEAFELADRVAVMKEGRILQTAPPEELARRPRPGYVADLLALRGAAS